MAYDVKAAEAYIRQSAAAKGLDPNVAVRVARSEGLANGIYQSNLGKGGRREPSYGPFQLLVGGPGTGYGRGLGNAFIDKTGLDPRDPSTVPQQIDFALDQAKVGGWSPWYGAAKVGVGKWDGIKGGTPSGQAPDVQIAVTGGGDTTSYGGAGDDTPGVEPAMDNPMPQNVGGLGGLGGFVRGPEFGNFLTALGTSLMSSPSNAPLSNFGAAMSDIEDRSVKREYYAQQRADRQELRAEKAADRQANMLALRSLGFNAEEAAGLASSPSAASTAIAGRETARELGEKNQTKAWITKNYPDLADVPMDVALRTIQERRAQAVKPPELVTIYNDEGQEQKATYDPKTQSYTPVGGSKTLQRGSADDRKAMREAEDNVFAVDQAITTLDSAAKVSPDAYEGATAGLRSWLGNNLPDAVVPDFIASPEASQATRTLDQLTTEGALQQLKSIFGGAPTEGERQILLDIQGASNQPEAVRRQIYARAQQAAERRRQFNADRAAELRGLTYGKGGQAPPAAVPTPTLAPEAVNPFRNKYGLE